MPAFHRRPAPRPLRALDFSFDNFQPFAQHPFAPANGTKPNITTERNQKPIQRFRNALLRLAARSIFDGTNPPRSSNRKLKIENRKSTHSSPATLCSPAGMIRSVAGGIKPSGNKIANWFPPKAITIRPAGSSHIRAGATLGMLRANVASSAKGSGASGVGRMRSSRPGWLNKNSNPSAVRTSHGSPSPAAGPGNGQTVTLPV